nr:helix-turn-helix transcriptional regulator [Corynebacterium freneyi]
MQSLWFAVVDLIALYVRVSPVRLTRLQRARSRPTSSHERAHGPLRREAILVRDLLHRQIVRPWTLAELADFVSLSPKQLTRVFTSAFGKTPTAYLTMLRVQEMACLLRDTNITVAAAGQRVGWRSRSRATEAFIAHTRIAPSRYRDMQPVATGVP